MSNPRYPRGSEWRRWDLQVHTPFSALNNGFGSNFDQYAKLLLERAVEKGIAAIGVTDYFSIEAYKADSKRSSQHNVPSSSKILVQGFRGGLPSKGFSRP